MPYSLITTSVYHFLPNATGFAQFKVCAFSSADICLANDYEGSLPNYIIILGDAINTKTVIRRKMHEDPLAVADTRNILSDKEFRGFWVRWETKAVEVGREGVSKPFITYRVDEHVPLKPINYIGIRTTCMKRGKWLVEEPRVINLYTTVGMVYDHHKWLPYQKNGVPGTALKAGQEDGNPLYIIRAKQANGVVPGKLLEKSNVGYIVWNEKQLPVSEFEILCEATKCKWVACHGSHIPGNAVKAGEPPAEEDPLYIGRIEIDQNIVVGMVQKSRGLLIIPYKGEAFTFARYEVLVE